MFAFIVCPLVSYANNATLSVHLERTPTTSELYAGCKIFTRRKQSRLNRTVDKSGAKNDKDRHTFLLAPGETEQTPESGPRRINEPANKSRYRR